MNNYLPSIRFRALACVGALTLSLLLGGCDVVSRLRAVFHPDESPQGVAGSSAITIEVQPHDNIEVFLDGEPVTTQSPYTARHLKAERHQLHIEASGFHPFSLSFDLPSNKHLTVPIALRPLPPPNDGRGDGAPRAQATPRAPLTGAGVKAARLLLGAAPPQTILWDGQEVTEPETTLDRQWGTLQAGELRISFRYSPIGILEFSPPHDQPGPEETITWLKNTEVIAPGSSFRIPRGKTQIIRFSSTTGRQILILERP